MPPAGLAPSPAAGSLLGARMAVSTAQQARRPRDRADGRRDAVARAHERAPRQAGGRRRLLELSRRGVDRRSACTGGCAGPASRFGPLLVAFDGAAHLGRLLAGRRTMPLLFDIGVLAEAPFFVLTFYLFLAFPMGRLEPRAARWLMGALVLGVLAFFLPWALFSPVIAGGGPLTALRAGVPGERAPDRLGPGCSSRWRARPRPTPRSRSRSAVLVVYLLRLPRPPSRPQRRALASPSGSTSLLFLPGVLRLPTSPPGSSTLDAEHPRHARLGASSSPAILLPLGFLVALLQAEPVRRRGALRKLLERLAAAPDARALARRVIAEALDDAALQLGYHDPAAGRFREADGTELAPAGAPAGRALGAGRARRRSPSPRWWSTRRSPRTPSSCRPRRRPRCSPSRTAAWRASCGRRARGSCQAGPRGAAADRARSPRQRAAAPRRPADPPRARGRAARPRRAPRDPRAARPRGRRGDRRAARRRPWPAPRGPRPGGRRAGAQRGRGALGASRWRSDGTAAAAVRGRRV